MRYTTSLTIQPRHELWFLYPSDPEAGPTQDTVLTGEVTLTLAAAKKVKRLDVELTGVQSLTVQGRYQQYETLRKTLTIRPCEDGKDLPAGAHTFRWSLIVPANTAPYERATFGRTIHFVKAFARGCGNFGTDLSDLSSLALVACHHEREAVPNGFNHVSETLHPVFGPVRARLFAKYSLVSGYVRFTLSMPSVLDAVELEDIQVINTMHVEVENLKQPGVKDVKDFRQVLWKLRAEERKSNFVAEGEDVTLVRQFRLPNDDHIRQSTNFFSKTGIRVSHILSILIHYKHRGSARKELRFTFPTVIASCDCSVQVLQLPTYSLDDPALSTTSDQWRTVTASGRPRDCMCSRPVEEIQIMYGSDDSRLSSDDFYGNEGERIPAWQDKTPTEERGQDYIDDLIRRNMSSPPNRSTSNTPSPRWNRLRPLPSPSSSRSRSLGP